MAQETKSFSLREDLKSAISEFLSDEKFKHVSKVKLGVLEVINLLADYREEDVPLFPEVLITTDPVVLKSIPHSRVDIATGRPIEENEFKYAIKLCAPLAVQGWSVFVEIIGNRLSYGLVNAEISETSPSLYTQAVGQMANAGLKPKPLALIRNIGSKTVELIGNLHRVQISLTLSRPEERTFREVEALCEAASSKCEAAVQTPLRVFLQKGIDEALRTGHGSLIGIVDNDEASLATLKEKLEEKGGIYLPQSIDLASVGQTLSWLRTAKRQLILRTIHQS